MNALEVAAAKLEISEVAAKYGHYCDHPGWDRTLDLFTDDAVFDATTVYGTTMTGKDELRNFYETAPVAVAHHPTSLFTELHDDGSARTLCKMIVIFAKKIFSVDYEWEFVRQGDSWLIRRMTIGVVGNVVLAEKASV